MKKILIIFLVLININVFSAFNQYSFSCKANSLGECSLVENEPLAIFLNPANFFIREKNCFEVSYFKPYNLLEGINLSNSNIIFTNKAKFISFSLGYSNFEVRGLYEEEIVLMNIQTYFNNLNKKLPKLSSGINIKILLRELFLKEDVLGETPELRNNTKVSNYSYDFGLIYKNYEENFVLGFTFKDVNQPNVGFLEKEKLPFTVSFSNKYNFGDFWRLEDFTLYSELRYRQQNWGDLTQKFYWAFGAETYFNFNTVAIRIGINKNSFNFGFGYNELKFYKFKLTIDYFFGLFFSYLKPISNHNFSFKIGF